MLRFGTDGVRGDADTDLPTPYVVALGRAIASVFGGSTRVLVGRDTRVSGERIEADVARGLGAHGATPVLLGVLPTPAIAYLASRGEPAVIVSASHNPWTDNGLKVVGPDGRKLPDAQEVAIEDALERFVAESPAGASARDASAVERMDDASDAYDAHLVQTLGGRTLDGLRVVLDCANGAGYAVGPRALRDVGADVVVLCAEPDGRNINDGCGSTHPESLQAAVVAHGADLGLALDGDADRVLAVDERGTLVDGDEIMTMCALDLHARGELPNDAIAVTVMTNLGLRRALRTAGIDVVETPVGDRHVVAAMQERGLVLGGEQSGHIVFAQHATTGDGILTGLLVCDLVRRSGRPLSALAAAMTKVPQLLVNVRVATRPDVTASEGVATAVKVAEERLGAGGRVLVRASGTEPLVRIMVEADEQAVAEEIAAGLRAAVAAEFGAADAPENFRP